MTCAYCHRPKSEAASCPHGAPECFKPHEPTGISSIAALDDQHYECTKCHAIWKDRAGPVQCPVCTALYVVWENYAA